MNKLAVCLVLLVMLAAPAYGEAAGKNRGTAQDVTVSEGEGSLAGVSSYEVFAADESEYRTSVVLSASRAVRDFRILALSFKDMGN
ncbi:MAG: hypothetical protein J6I40_08235, partial [Mailhella sp.]|nr:hypothetical protein [Mailhella sp.]